MPHDMIYSLFLWGEELESRISKNQQDFRGRVLDSCRERFPEIGNFESDEANKIIKACYDAGITPTKTSMMLENYFS